MERGVKITLDNGTLGRTQGVERVFGMMLYGNIALSNEANFPCAINSVADLSAIGITNSPTILSDQYHYQSRISNQDVYRQISEFYSFPENAGRKVWLHLTEDNRTMSSVLDIGGPAEYLINAAQGEISVLFVGGFRSQLYNDSLTYVGGLSSEVAPAIIKAQALAETYSAKTKPLRIVIDGYGMGTSTQLTNLTTMSNNRVAINISASALGDRHSCQGLLAGRLAYIPVNESAGWVGKGSLPILGGFLTDGRTLETYENQINEILDKGYIALQKYPHKYGYFFCNPRMATALTDDYKALTDGCTIDKAHILAYQTFVDYVNGQMYVTAKGTLNLLQVRAIEADIENVITQQMIAKGECSFVKCVIDPTQKVLSTNELVIGVKIGPTATLELLRVKLGFAQSV
jgi:Protein of unknown function (DUF2586)